MTFGACAIKDVGEAGGGANGGEMGPALEVGKTCDELATSDKAFDTVALAFAGGT